MSRACVEVAPCSACGEVDELTDCGRGGMLCPDCKIDWMDHIEQDAREDEIAANLLAREER
jgi:hypothetical protein